MSADVAGPTAAIMRAINDPGSILPRLKLHDGGLEPLTEWQTRAVEEFAVPYIAAAERERVRQIAERSEAVYLEFCDQKPYCAHGDHTKPFADLIGDPA